MPEVNVEIEVYCSCGEGLCSQSTSGNTQRRNQPYITVEPCQKCLGSVEDKSYEKGYSEGVIEGEKNAT